MEAESSPFESSDMLASFLASTGFLEESWRLCTYANAAASGRFWAEQRGGVGYLAFSAVQPIDGSEPSCGTLVRLDEFGFEDLFSPLKCDGGDGECDETVRVDALFLRRFLEYYMWPGFQNQIGEFLRNVKMIILTGHSFGATTASLTALWLLSQLQPVASPISVLCLTFGTPLLGNESLSRAILQERWGGSFCNVVSKLDVVPKLFFAPLASLTPQLHLLLQFWQDAMASPSLEPLSKVLREQNFNEFFSNIKVCVEHATKSEGAKNSLFWPLGSYLFCSKEGAICLDNATSVVKMMHLMLETVSSASSFEDHLNCFEDHLKYGYYTGLLSSQFLKKINVSNLSESSYEAGVIMALQSSGINPQDDNISKPAKDCLQKARHMGRAPNLNNAYLGIKLSKITPCRAQLEWYKTRCDESSDQLGYYDTFKRVSASRRESKINMNLHELGAYWDEVIGMLERNAVSYDFHRRSKWVHASHFYVLLAEPLEIARYYRHGMHKKKGHYIKHGRDRRFQILDRWWKRKIAVVAQEPQEINHKRSRSRYSSLTQDSLFWARVEEAMDWLDNAKRERDTNRLKPLLAEMEGFEKYAKELIERKEVSIDVLAKNSSYKVWAEEWKASKSKFLQPPSNPSQSEMDCD